MTLRSNIARNAALRENVFMMAICIELRIPLFLVGKPGSSKSLAKSIIADSMHGRASTNSFMKQFKQVLVYNTAFGLLFTTYLMVIGADVFLPMQSALNLRERY